MEKYIIDERTGWEYELIGEQYYPTGRAMRNSVMTPSELPEDNGPGEEKPIGVWGADLRWRSLPQAEAPTEAAAETNGICATSGNTKKRYISICLCPESCTPTSPISTPMQRILSPGW